MINSSYRPMSPSRFTQWRVSSYSASTAGNCVEVGTAPGELAVRDTKLGESSPMLVFSMTNWRSFVQTVTR
jgi:Domain of unknown function (DUF397)